MSAQVMRRRAAATAVAVFGILFLLTGVTPSTADDARVAMGVTTGPVVATSAGMHAPEATLVHTSALRTAHADRTQPLSTFLGVALLLAAALLLVASAGTVTRSVIGSRGLHVGRGPPVFAFAQ